MKDDCWVSEKQHKAGVGRRLRAAIEVLGLTQTEVARVLGVTPSKLGNWIRGDNYPAEWPIAQFCERYGVSADWIYLGKVTGMIKELADALWSSEHSLVPEEAEPHRAVRQPPAKSKKAAGIAGSAAAQTERRRAAGQAAPVTPARKEA